MDLSSLTLISPVLLGLLMIFLMAIALPAGFLTWAYNLLAIGYCFLLMSRGFMVLNDPAETISGFNGMLIVDDLAAFAAFFLGAVGLTVFLKTPRYMERNGWSHGEFYLLALVSLTGMIVTASTRHFTGLFLGLETMTVPLYILMSADRQGGKGRAAALKYLALGGVGSALLLYGIALIYGATGSLAFPSTLGESGLGTLGGLFLLAGLLFKIGAFPFQGWVPDVYGDSPTPVTGFMATGVKIAALAALLRLLAPLGSIPLVGELLPLVAVLTMTIGNLMALGVKKPKAVLAYSSIAHTGYLLVGYCAGTGLSDGILLYLASYTLMTLGAFAVLSAVPGDEPELLRGLVKSRPAMAVGFALCILSLAGIPPLVGFYGKLTIFAGAWETAGLRWLVIAGVLNSLIALGYYIPLVRSALFASPGTEHDMTSRSLRLELACALSAAAVVLLGLFPGQLMSIIDRITP